MNLDHVRTLSQQKPDKLNPVHTTVHIDSSWVEWVLHVSDRPEDILHAANITD